MPPRAMEIPTAEEISAYAASIGFQLDAGYFIDYWEARGWMMKSGVRMRSWQATIRNWQRMDKARASGKAPVPQKSQAELLRDEADERRNRVICEHAGRIIALQSWIKSGSNCPFSANPQEDIERIKIKIQDHYGPRGIDELRTEVIKLKRGGKR